MSSAVATIAAEVTALLNAASASGAFSQEFTAVRSYVPRHDSETSALQVFVVGTSIPSIETIAGDFDATECVIEIGVFDRVDQTDLEEVDAMVQLVEEIGAYLCDTTGNIASGQRMTTPEVDPLYDVNQIQNGVFASAQRITYRSCVDTRPVEPTMTVPGPQTTTANDADGPLNLFGLVHVTHPGGLLNFRVSTNGVQLVVNFNGDVATAASALTMTGTAAQINNELETLSASAGDPEVCTITLQVRRNGETAWVETKTIAVTVVAA